MASGVRRCAGSGKRASARADTEASGGLDTGIVPRAACHRQALFGIKGGADALPLRPQLPVRLIVAVDRVDDDAHRFLALPPTPHLHTLPFEVLVALEEVLDLLELVPRDVGDVEPLLVVRVVARHGEDLVVRLPL